MNKQKSFTLIELLVVIAIIGIISSIVLVNLQGTKEKARIAKGLEFSQTVHNVLGANAVGVWSFNEGLGTIFNDASGYGNHGTNNGATWTAEGDTPSGKGYALDFDGSDYIEVLNNNNLNFGTGDFTISVWIKTADGGVIISKNGPGGITDTGYSLYSFFEPSYDEILFFDPVDDLDYSPLCFLDGDINIVDNKWHHIIMTKDGNYLKIFIDSVLKEPCDALLLGNINNNYNLIIGGSDDIPSFNFNGLIDEVRIYNQALIVQ